MNGEATLHIYFENGDEMTLTKIEEFNHTGTAVFMVKTRDSVKYMPHVKPSKKKEN